MEFVVESSSIFKTGIGARGPWTIFKLKLVGNQQEPTGFDQVVPGDRVTVEQTQSTGKDGKVYSNLNYKKVDGAAAQQQTTSGQPSTPAPSTDARAVKLLVMIAEQIGVDKNQILNVLS